MSRMSLLGETMEERLEYTGTLKLMSVRVLFLRRVNVRPGVIPVGFIRKVRKKAQGRGLLNILRNNR